MKAFFTNTRLRYDRSLCLRQRAVFVIALTVLSFGVSHVRAEENTKLAEPGRTAATNLTRCPDCTENVSKRALMCPHCGCPGEAIQHAVNKAEEAARPKAVVSVVADHVDGFGVAIRDASSTYIILDPFLLADSMKLELHDLVSGDNLAYTEVQLAENAPLMRLRVKSDKIAFTDLSSIQSEPAAFLDATGTPSGQEHAVVGLDAEGKISSLMTLSNPASLHEGMKWKSVSPKPLRQQINLLARMIRERDSGNKPKLSSTEAAIVWLTPAFSKLAAQLTR